MKAFLHKAWGSNYAGQVLTNVQRGSIPDDVAEFFEDNEPTPNDVVKDNTATARDRLTVTDDSIPVDAVRAVAQEKKDLVAKAQDAVTAAPVNRVAVQEDATQRAARNADLIAAKMQGDPAEVTNITDEERKRSDAGRGPSVKVSDAELADRGVRPVPPVPLVPQFTDEQQRQADARK